MNIAVACIRRPMVTWTFSLVLALGGIAVFGSMSKFEDPEFTIKSAVVFTPYPGATPLEVETEVTDRIESAIQQLPYVDEVRSESSHGMSKVTVDIRSSISQAQIPQVWDELRRKIGDAQSQLPPGAGPSLVNDDFGDVYGILYAITGEGFSPAELHTWAKVLRKELLTVNGVAKVALAGVQPEVITVEIPRARRAAMGISGDTLASLLSQHNNVIASGSMVEDGRRLRIELAGAPSSVEALRDLLIANPQTRQIIRLGDVADIRRGYREPAGNLLFYNGMPAIHLGISTMPGGNVVTVGERVHARLQELRRDLPHGIEVHVVSMQGQAVAVAINNFLINLGESVAIVLVVLLLAIGLRPGLIIGINLLFIVLGTLLIMHLTGVALQRISLGALIIAMGMLVDNAIVVVDGVMARLRQGLGAEEACQAVVGQTRWPLLGATVIAVLAFSAIGLSPDSTGEFTRSLFLVVLYSLLLSWVLSITLTPLLCVQWLRVPTQVLASSGGGALQRMVRRLTGAALHFRWAVVLTMAVLLAVGVAAFGLVKQSFFPSSDRPQFLVNLWLPSGTDISDTTKVVADIDAAIRALPGVVGTHATVGQGMLRFMLTYDTQSPNPAYGQVIVDVADMATAEKQLFPAIRELIAVSHPEVRPYLMRFRLGPGAAGSVGVRFSGDDADVLRGLADQALAVLGSDPRATNLHTDWTERAAIIRPVFNEARARTLGVTRRALAEALAEATEGRPVGVYRSGEDLLPILLRAPANERRTVQDLSAVQVYLPAQGRPVPVVDVLERVETSLTDLIIARVNRRRSITVGADPLSGLASELRAAVLPDIEAIALPPGYTRQWVGEYKKSSKAQEGLVMPMLIAIGMMYLLLIVLFNGIRQSLVIFLCVPLSIVGVSLGLLLTGSTFGFMPMLGVLSLIGMLIKNGIVLVDEIEVLLAGGASPWQAVLDATVCRTMPVILAAGTTVLGMLPLVLDVFFKDMAIAIMAGLTFATVLTLVVIPVLYAIFFGVRPPPGK